METFIPYIVFGIWVIVAAFVACVWWTSERYDLNDPQDRADYEINRQFW